MFDVDLIKALGIGAVAAGLIGWVLAQIHARYVKILGFGQSPRGSEERKEYRRLRRDLQKGGRPWKSYRRWLRGLLGRVDRFFGDTAAPTLFPQAFGLRRAAPLWTAPAYDRCLLLALLYPLLTVFVVWCLSGHVGPAEAALGLPDRDQVSPIGRVFVLFSISVSGLLYWRGIRVEGWWGLLYFAGAVALAVAVGGAGAGAGAVAGAVAVAVGILNHFAAEHRRQGVFLLALTLGLIGICFVTSDLIAGTPGWRPAGPLLLFYGILTLINAPFDWLALGFTRALLRRGLELTGWWPVGLAIVDVVAALAGVALSAAMMILGVQLFDHVAEHAGGAPVLQPLPLLDGMRDRPGDAEFYWVYVTLVTTLLPSLVNLALGAVSLARGVPFLASRILAQMPEAGAVKEWDRPLVATFLTAHVVVGFVLAFVAWLGMLYTLVVWLPALAGTGLLGLARQLAEYDLPAHFF